jgi:hypothetical protein
MATGSAIGGRGRVCRRSRVANQGGGGPQGDGRRWTPPLGPGGAWLGRPVTEIESVPIGMEGGSK